MPTYSLTSDDELLLLSRFGNFECRNELDKRYCLCRNYHVNRVMPEILCFYSSWDVSNASLTIYLKCLELYRFGHGCFESYFETALHHELAHMKAALWRNGFTPCSMDEEKFGKDKNESLHDVISSDSLNDNPQQYIDYFEGALALKKAPKKIDQEVLMVARMRLEGTSFSTIAERLRISVCCAYHRYEAYRREVLKLLNLSDPKKK